MNTPIADFVKKYVKSDFSRFHMPGHKGKKLLGAEKLDITEVLGADVLSDSKGIILESENNARGLFKSGKTIYSTEGSTAVICGMLALVKSGQPDRNTVIAARNVHKAFVNGAALCDLDVKWCFDDNSSTLLKCEISPETLEKTILSCNTKPLAVYVTSPDYLGNLQNIPELARVCKKYDIPLLVDNAHGAYLAFLDKSLHPIHQGATMCCDSAHKTFPVLTGGAYLHISEDAPRKYIKNAKNYLTLFSSTSPSYLTLQSMDLCNKYLDEGFKDKLKKCILKAEAVKKYAKEKGFETLETEPLKITVDAKKSGYLGEEFAEILRKNKIEPEFYDEDFVVLMCTPQNKNKDFKRLKKAFEASKEKIPERRLFVPEIKREMTIRQAVFSDFEEIPVELADGRICASLTVSCPPAVPIAVSGEVVTEEMIKLLKAYKTETIKVVKKPL